jgi:hypothetical protein
MNINIDIDNIEDIAYLKSISEKDYEDILKTAISIGIKSIEMSKTYMSGNSYFDPLKNIIEDSNLENKNELLEISNMLKDLMNIKNNSSRKGKLGESLAMNSLVKKYPNWRIDDTAGTSHEADLFAYSDDYGKILYEIKTYSTNVGKKEIEKFKNDVMATNSNYGIFISQTSGIVGKKMMDYEIYNGKILIYVACAGLNGHGIEFGTEFLISLITSGCLEKKTIIKNKEVEDVLKIINDNMLELDECINNFSRTKSQLHDMRTIINGQIDLLHKHLIEYEIQGKNIYMKILDVIKNNYDNDDIILCREEEKIQDYLITLGDKGNILNTIMNKIKDNNYILALDNNKDILYIYKDDNIICKIVIEDNELKWIFNIKENNSLTFLPKYEYIENTKLIIITNNKYEDIHINILLERIDK